MKQRVGAAALLLLWGCATAPLAPNPQVDLTGGWRIVALNGEATPEPRRTFNFRYTPPSGWAQFGCNGGSGATAVRDGWLVTGDWIITVAGCRNDEVARLERKGFEVLSKPLAIETVGGQRVRLRNERGSLLLERLPVPQLAGTRWKAIRTNMQPLAAGEGLRVEFLSGQWQATGACNFAKAVYTQVGHRLQVGASSTTERGCNEEAHAFDDRVFRILSHSTFLWSESPRHLTLHGDRGSITLQQLP